MSTAAPLRILQVHNRYRERGGEDAVADDEARLLQAAGHRVERYLRDNAEIDAIGPARAALQGIWSTQTARELADLARRCDAQLVHVHNSFLRVSPSAHATAHGLGLPVLQTLHNHRLLCPQAMLLRDGRHCDDCVGRTPWPALRHGCWRGSRAATAAVVAQLQWHRWRGTWSNDVTLYLALSEGARATFVRGGLPEARLRVHPNFAEGPTQPPEGPRDGVLFVGRLSPEKGTAALAACAAAGEALRVLGDGPERQALAGLPGLELLGRRGPDEVRQALSHASLLLMPSQAAESFPRVLAEAAACALPVLAWRSGALGELVEHGVTGWLVQPGDVPGLLHHLRLARQHPEQLRRMGQAARERWAAHWSPTVALRRLEGLYREAIALRGGGLA